MCAEVTLTTFPAYPSTSVDVRSVRAKLAKSVRDEDDPTEVCDPSSDRYDADRCLELQRSKQKRSDDGCACGCDECVDGDCSECSDSDCQETRCDDCPQQIRAAHHALLLRRMR